MHQSIPAVPPPPPPGLTPGHKHFFGFGWQIPGGGDKKRRQMPHQRDIIAYILNEKYIAFHTFHSIPFHSITLYSTTLHCIHCISYSTLHCITLHYIAFHTLHCIALYVIYIFSIMLKLYSPRYPVNITFSRRGRSAK